MRNSSLKHYEGIKVHYKSSHQRKKKKSSTKPMTTALRFNCKIESQARRQACSLRVFPRARFQPVVNPTGLNFNRRKCLASQCDPQYNRKQFIFSLPMLKSHSLLHKPKSQWQKLGLTGQEYFSAEVALSSDRCGYDGKARVTPDTSPQQARQTQNQTPPSPLPL